MYVPYGQRLPNGYDIVPFNMLRVKRNYISYCTAAGFDIDGLDHDDNDNNDDNAKHSPSTPTLIRTGTDNQNAALIATTSDGIIIAFRGTIPLPKKGETSDRTLRMYMDWFQDFDVRLVRPVASHRYIMTMDDDDDDDNTYNDTVTKTATTATTTKKTGKIADGRMHEGLYRSTRALWEGQEDMYPWWFPTRYFWNEILRLSGSKSVDGIFAGPWALIRAILGDDTVTATTNDTTNLRIELRRHLAKLNFTVDDKTNTTANLPTKVYVTGHSKGGGMASIAALLVRHELHNNNNINNNNNNNNDSNSNNNKNNKNNKNNNTNDRHHLQNNDHLSSSSSKSVPQIAKSQNTIDPNPIVYTFGSVKPGDSAFASYYNARIKQYSYENYYDPVPLYPFSNYQSYVLEKELDKRENTIRKKVRVILFSFVSIMRKMELHYEYVGTRLIINKNITLVPLIIEYEQLDAVKNRSTYFSSGKRGDLYNGEYHQNGADKGWFVRLLMKLRNLRLSIADGHLHSDDDDNDEDDVSSTMKKKLPLYDGPTLNAKTDLDRIRGIVTDLSNGSSPLAHHKPSCRLGGYMHGVGGNFCERHAVELQISKEKNEE